MTSFKFQDGGRPPFWKWFYLYVSRESSDFNEIWCADANFGSNNMTNIKILQIQNGGRLPYRKSFFFCISTIYFRFTRNLVWESRITLRNRSRDQNTKCRSLYLSRNHMISIKCGVHRQILLPTTVTWQSNQNFAISKWQTDGLLFSPTNNILCYIRRVRSFYIVLHGVVRLTRNFVWRSKVTLRHWSRYENTKFRKFKMGKYKCKDCSLSTTYSSEMTDRKQQKQAVREAATICSRPLQIDLWKLCPSHVWRGLPLCQF